MLDYGIFYEFIPMDKINCEENEELAKLHEIEGFPTIKLCKNGIKRSLAKPLESICANEQNQSLL